MKIFLDTADTEEVAKAMQTGTISGVTTNPTLIKASGRKPIEVYQELMELGVEDISMEVVGTAEEMYEEAIELHQIFDQSRATESHKKLAKLAEDWNKSLSKSSLLQKKCYLDFLDEHPLPKPVVTIKLPMTQDGLAVCKKLSLLIIRTNITLVFNIAQAVLAAQAGATYVSPFVGRIDDQGYAGLEVVRGIADMFQKMDTKTKVLAASIRTPQRAVRSLYNGADIVTVPPKVFKQMFTNILTDDGLRQFDADSQSIPQ